MARRWLAACAVVAAAATPALADDDFGGGVVIFARGSALMQVDARGRNEAELAQLPAKVTVRALRCDADGTVLLADLAGKWAWLPLDGSTKTLIDLPCADGPAQLTVNGDAVLCRSPKAASQSIVVELVHAPGAPARTGKVTAVDVPPATARLTGEGVERRLVWADAAGVWSAPPGDVKRKALAAHDVPVRGFLASPDGTRAIGTYTDTVYTDAHHSQIADVLMTLSLDGKGARRKAIRDGVAVEWSQDNQWVLVQDGANACIMRVSGGQYKCWKGYTAASLAGDGRWALALGNRDGGRAQRPARAAKPVAKKPAPPSPGDEPSDEPESSDTPPANDDVSVAPPTGPLSLYRLRLEGAFTDRPTLLVKVVDGAAVWVAKGN